MEHRNSISCRVLFVKRTKNWILPGVVSMEGCFSEGNFMVQEF